MTIDEFDFYESATANGCESSGGEKEANPFVEVNKYALGSSVIEYMSQAIASEKGPETYKADETVLDFIENLRTKYEKVNISVTVKMINDKQITLYLHDGGKQPNELVMDLPGDSNPNYQLSSPRVAESECMRCGQAGHTAQLN